MKLHFSEILKTANEAIQVLLILLPFLCIAISAVVDWVEKRREKWSASVNELPPLRSGEHARLLTN